MTYKVDLDQKATQIGFADLVGVSQQTVSEKVTAGVLKKGGSLLQWLQAYCQKLREEAAGRGGGEDQAEAARAKTRESTANAQLKELQFHKEIRNLIPVSELEPILESWAVTARSEMQYAVEKLVAAIQSKHSIEVEQGLIDDALGSAYTSIAGYPRDLADNAGEDSEEVATA